MAECRIVVAMEGGCVLVVDGDPLVRLAIDRQLEVLGFDALVLNTGAEAIKVLEAGYPLDVLLLDVRLADLDAHTVARVAVGLRPELRVLFMCGREPQASLDRPVLVKPFSTSELGRALGVQPR